MAERAPPRKKAPGGPKDEASSGGGAVPTGKSSAGDSAEGRGAANPKTGRIKRPRGKTQKKQKAVPAAEQELEPITPFKRGLPLGVKFGTAVIAVILLFTGLLGYLTYAIAERELSEQIIEQGVSTASTLEKAVDRGLWDAPPERAIKEGKETRYLDVTPRDVLVADWTDRLHKLVDSSTTIVCAGLIEIDPQNPLAQIPTAKWPKEDVSVTGMTLVREERDAQNQVYLRIQEAKLNGEERVRRFDYRVDLHAERDEKISALIQKASELEGNLQPTAAQEQELTQALAELTALTGQKDLATVAEWEKWREESPPLEKRSEWVTDQARPPWVSVFVKASRLDELRAGLFKRLAAVTGCGALAAILFTVVITTLLTGPIREIELDAAEVARGNFDHQTKVRARDEIGALAHVFNIMVRNLRIAQENLVQRKSFERELGIAKEIQEKLLPEKIPQIPGGYDIHNYYRAAKEVGGDYYDFIVIDQTHVGIIVADVAGKGIPGAMVMTMVRSLVRLASVRNVSPADTFKKVNRILHKDIRRGMFVTAAYMVLNVKTRVLKLASAGHNPVILWRAAKGEHELIKPAGIALGFDKGTMFDTHVKEVEVQLEPGDRVVTYTDGVNEAMNDDSEEFGDDRFIELVKQHGQKSSQEFVQAVVGALDRHRGNAEQSDDITIVTLAVQAGAGAAAAAAATVLTDGGDGGEA